MTAGAGVFFVDDEPDVLAGLKRGLRARRKRWDMRFFTSGAEALAAMRDTPCLVLVSDLCMPGMTGLQLARRAKSMEPNAQVVILTGAADLQTAIRAINETDVFRFYTKPCPIEELAGGIDAAIRQHPVNRPAVEPAPSPAGGIGEAALAKLPVGIAVVDRRVRVEFMNPRAMDIVTRDDGLFVAGDGVLRAKKSEDSGRIHELVERVLDRGDPGESAAVAVSRPSMLRPLSVLVSALPNDCGPPRAVLFLTDPEAQPRISANVIATLFGLTDSEARLVRALAEGRRLNEAADAIGVTVSSARTYLKQVFSKTETSRQAELVQLVLTSPAVLETRPTGPDTPAATP